MRQKYRRRIRQFAETALKAELEAAIAPYLNALPSEIEARMKDEISQFPLPEEESLGPRERMGSRLQHEGRAIAEQLFPRLLEETRPYLVIEVKKKKIVLRKERLIADKSRAAIKQLIGKVRDGRIDKTRAWCGADVIITPTLIPADQLSWNHSGDIQVVTGSQDFAESLSWLFTKLRDIMQPFVHFRNKFEFYGELAEAANRTLRESVPPDQTAVMLAVIARAEEFREEWLPVFDDYQEKEKSLLDSFDPNQGLTEAVSNQCLTHPAQLSLGHHLRQTVIMRG